MDLEEDEEMKLSCTSKLLSSLPLLPFFVSDLPKSNGNFLGRRRGFLVHCPQRVQNVVLRLLREPPVFRRFLLRKGSLKLTTSTMRKSCWSHFGCKELLRIPPGGW